VTGVKGENSNWTVAEAGDDGAYSGSMKTENSWWAAAEEEDDGLWGGMW